MEKMRSKNGLAASINNGKAGSDRLILAETRSIADKKKLLKSEKKRLKEEQKYQKNISKGKTYCQACKKKCSGEVLRVQDKYFHTGCFKCKVCASSLAQGGFFSKDGAYYCTGDYQRNFGTKCASCGDYVEGEVVTALGKTYHQKCFTCARCRQPFPSGEKVTYTGKEVLCQKCVQIPIRDATPKTSPTSTSPLPNECAGCREDLKEGQVLVALDKSWHIWCFKCHSCGTVLHGEYMGKDGVPYCERDYQKQFGVKCAYCNRYISGKVLQAGDNHHFHPTCARCSKCGDPFGDGEEMYLQGGAVWHPRCGPGPQTEDGRVLNGPENGNVTDTDVSTKDFDRHSTSGASELQFSMRSRTPSLNGSLYSPTSMHRKHYSHTAYRTPSPGLILREYNKSGTIADDISRIYTYSYLTDEPSLGYLKKPIDPYDKAPTSPHFHRPTSQNSLRSSTGAGGKRHGSRSAMKVLVDSIRSETPRSKSPHMNNEEPIELSHYPGAKPPKPGEPPKIERDDFPAPPYPYTDPERRKRWSDSYKGVPVSDDEEVDGLTEKELDDTKLKKEEEELSKIASGIGKVFLKNVKEREKIKQWKAAHLDPRNASRTPSANKEPAYRLRYDNPIGASPSRNLDHSRPFDDEDFDRSLSCRSSSMSRPGGWNYNVVSSLRMVPKPGYGFKANTLPSGNGYAGSCDGLYGWVVSCFRDLSFWQLQVVSALRHIPKPGYGLAPRSHTFSSSAGSYSHIPGDYSFTGMGVKTHSTDFSSGKSDISTGSITDVETRMHSELGPVSYAVGRYGMPGVGGGYGSQVRRSLPNMAHQMLISEPAKIYPYHLLVITNYRLPADVDRLNLERHLSDQEFEAIFQLSRPDFYRLPQWRRNELKRRARLF